MEKIEKLLYSHRKYGVNKEKKEKGKSKMSSSPIFLLTVVSFQIHGITGQYSFFNAHVAERFIQYCVQEPLINCFSFHRFNTSERHFNHGVKEENKIMFDDDIFDEIVSFNRKLI